MSVMKYKDPETGEVKKVFAPTFDAYTKTETDTALQKKVNPNLLVNWYFANPVNQRGQTTYTTSSDEYTIDRWMKSVGTLNIEDGCISVSLTDWGSIVQVIEPDLFKALAGKTLTFSVLHKDGQLKKITFTPDSNYANTDVWIGFGGEYGTMIYRWSNGRPNLAYANSQNGELVAIKLELGDNQTLAHQDADGNWVLNEFPNYNEELLKCIQSTADVSDTYANKVIYHTGNKPTLADIGAAPAGYGYGESLSIYVDTSKETINDRFDALLADMPTYSAKQVLVKDPAFSTSWFCGTLKKSNSYDDASFDGWKIAGVECIHKTKSDGTWWDWQYKNPFIFSPGNVYPLTEVSLYRCLYTITISCGAASNGKEVKVEIPGINSIVRYAAWDDGSNSGAPYDPSLFKIEKAPATTDFAGGIKITMTVTTGSPWVQVWFDKS